MKLKSKNGCFYFTIALLLLLIASLIIILWPTKEEKGYRFIGKVSVPDLDSISINIYQTTGFNWSTGLSYEIIDDSNNEVIVKRNFLYGTTTHYEKISSFYSGMCDSVIYITYQPPNKVYALHDLITNTGYPHRIPKETHKQTVARKNLLFERVKRCDENLIIK